MITDTAGYVQDEWNALTGTVNDIAGLASAGQAVGRVGDATGDLVAAMQTSNGGMIDHYQDSTARRESFARLDSSELDVIANPHNYTETEKKAVADKYNATYAEVRGIDTAETNFFAEGELNGDTANGTNGIDKRDTIAFTDGNADNNDIYYDANKINEGDNFAHALGHESSRHDQAEKGNVNQTMDGVSTALDERAYAAGKHSVAALEREFGYKGIERDTDKTVSYVRTEKDQALIHNGTKKADGVEDVQPYKWKTGEVEKGDTLTKITQEVNYNYGTKYDAETMAKINGILDPDKIKAGEKVQVGTIDENGKVWKPPYKEGVVDTKYFKKLDEDQQKITHYHRNTFTDEDLPETETVLEQSESNAWKKTKGDATAHNIGTEGNKDYRGKGARSNQQAIYDKNGNLVTTPENGGSYDYVSPSNRKKAQQHAVVDVEPWLKWGNTPQDTTTEKQRREAMSKSPEGKAGLVYLSGQEKVEQTKEFAKEKAQQGKSAINNGIDLFKNTFKKKPIPQAQGEN